MHHLEEMLVQLEQEEQGEENKMLREFSYRGKRIEELSKMDLKDLMPLLKSRSRRVLKKGFTVQQKTFLLKIDKKLKGEFKKNLRTHCRDLVVLPKMVGLEIYVHNGKEFTPVKIIAEMIGHRLGEFVLTRRGVKHSAPGIGATKSSTAIQAK